MKPKTTPKQLRPRAASGFDSSLEVSIKGGQLIISIGVKTLAWAAQPEHGGPLEGWRVGVGKHEEWATDVRDAMLYEAGDRGAQTRVTDFFDQMFQAAVDFGSGALVATGRQNANA